jgi:hypothetical protein
MLHEAADEDCRGLGIQRHADPFAGQLLRRCDVFAIDDDETVAKHARSKHWQRHEGKLLGGKTADVLGARHFAGVEFQPV